MQKRTILEEEGNLLNAIGSLATAYQEISVMKMKQAREVIDHSRDYVEKLQKIFESLKNSYPLESKSLKQDKNLDIAKVLITANSRLNGDILRKITDVFLKDNENQDADVYVLGKIGRENIGESKMKYKIQEVDVPDTNIKTENIKDLLQKLTSYKKLYVYYATFRSVITQDALKIEIPSIYSLSETSRAQKNHHASDSNSGKLYLFEPSGEEIAEYLNDSVSVTLVRQTIFETELSRNAARINAMAKLIDNTNQKKSKLNKDLLKFKREVMDKKQAERLTGISFWTSNI